MLRKRYSSVLVLVLMMTQVLGPAVLWAAEQRGVQITTNERVIVSAMSKGTLIAETNNESRTLHFGEVVKVGDELQTGQNTVAEVLIGKRAVITLGGGTTAQLTKLSSEQLMIQVVKGMVRVAASADALGENGEVIIQTPTSQVKTRGGIVRVMVNATSESVAQVPVDEAKAYLASYAPRTMVAANNADADIIQVEEGVAEILGAGPNGQELAVTSGQSVTRQVGRVGLLTEGQPQDSMRVGILSDVDHARTPTEGVENLVALQVDQATQLSQVLTGASTAGAEDAEQKDVIENPVNGATGGVQVATNNQSSSGGNTSNPTAPTNPGTGNMPTNPPPSGGNPSNPPTPTPPPVVATLFGSGSTANPTTVNPTESTGAGFTGIVSNNSGDLNQTVNIQTKVNGPARFEGSSKPKALLVFTSKDPLQTIVKNPFTSSEGNTFQTGEPCTRECFLDRLKDAAINADKFDSSTGNVDLDFKSLDPVKSKFTVVKELVLAGGTPNDFHGGIAPTETLIIRGAEPISPSVSATNQGGDTIPGGFNTSTTNPNETGPFPGPFDASTGEFEFTLDDIESAQIVEANSTLVLESIETREIISDDPDIPNTPRVPGTLDQFTREPSNPGTFGNVDGAITATGSNVVLRGGVTLDRGTVATIGTTAATDNYFTDPTHDIPTAEIFKGSVLAVIDRPNDVTTAVTVEDRLLGVYDGSQILPQEGDGNKALLSVLDAKLKGPTNGAPLIDMNAAFKDADPDTTNERDATGERPNVKVTSAAVVRSTKTLPTIPLDSGLLEASAPILALTLADMTTTSHFAGVAGKFDDIDNRPLSLELNDVMVALNASTLMVENGNLLNLNNARATIGYLFSLNNSSTLRIGVGEGNGTLFSLNNGAELNLTANALGVFGSGSNTLAIKNNLCAGACANLVNSAGEVFKLPNGSTLQAAGVTQDVVLPDGFNPFALADGAVTPNITVDGALFEVTSGSTLTIDNQVVVTAPVQ